MKGGKFQKLEHSGKVTARKIQLSLTFYKAVAKPKKSGQATCEHVNLTMHPLENFESLTAILAETVNENCKTVNSLLLYWRCCIGCTIRVSH